MIAKHIEKAGKNWEIANLEKSKRKIGKSRYAKEPQVKRQAGIVDCVDNSSEQRLQTSDILTFVNLIGNDNGK